ncbi:hypothetical protein [Desulfogranum marinum]|nr:hypothetical protein [Desulfogranum marinum]
MQIMHLNEAIIDLIRQGSFDCIDKREAEQLLENNEQRGKELD